MADASMNMNQEQNEEADKKKKNLEEKSKEDLIILVKKYLSLLQKSKNKTDELSKKCLNLEKEKNGAIQSFQTSEKELQSKIEDLQQNISELKAEKVNVHNKDQEIEQLKQKLKEAEEKSNSYTPTLRENEEQLSCLNLQLKSLKASCQCIQEENQKLQKSNKEKLVENSSLTEKISSLTNVYELLLSDFNLKSNEYDLLLNVKEDIEKKYEESVEKIHNFQRKNNKLFTANEDLQKDSTELQPKNVELVAEIETLQKANLELKEEFNQELQKKNEDINILFDDFQKCKKEKEKLVEQIEILSKNKGQISETDSETSKLKDIIHDLNQEQHTLKDNNAHLQSELVKCHAQIFKLEEEIKSLVANSQFSDKMGIELALLQGATTESLIHSIEPHNSPKETLQTINSNFDKKGGENSDKEFLFPMENSSGFEFALLQGGDASSFGIANESTADVCGSHIPSTNYFGTVPKSDIDDISQYKIIIEKKDVEIEKFRKNLEEYSILCRDTLDENNVLKEQLENLSSKINKKFIHQETNTEFKDPKYFEDINKLQGEKYEEIKNKNLKLSFETGSKSCENCYKLCYEISGFMKKIQSERNLDPDLDMSGTDALKLFKNVEDFCNKIISNLEKKSQELNDFNLQLELLVIGVKQGVRQKSSNTSYEVKNTFDENMNVLKQLLEELTTRSSSTLESRRNAQSDAATEMQIIKDELSELKEQNQFLEVENRELNIEIKKLKSTLRDADRNNDADYFEQVHQENAELYSIDESSEYDDKVETNSNKNPVKEETVMTTDVFTQAFPSVKDSVVQMDPVVTENKNISTQADSEVDCQKKIEELIKENEYLKKVIGEKSSLVESIHCEMDTLMTKVEELTDELHIKEDDLKHSLCLNADLRKILTEAENIKSQQINALNIAQNSLLDIKRKSIGLSEEVKSFSSIFKEQMTCASYDILNYIEERFKNIDNLKDMCSHWENNLKSIKEWIDEFIMEFKNWYKFMDQMASEVTEFDLSALEKDIQDSSQNFYQFQEICNEEVCYDISENINNLNSCKVKLFSALYHHLNNNYRTLVNELHNCKMSVIPTLENNLAELEKKVSECMCVDRSKEMKVVSENMQEKTTEESLKNSLADAEIKMNKFKQIALKWKKELAQTKEQYNDILSEKEEIEKQNLKLKDEQNKITEDQCNYVQNYQSLQSEFDKLQDECEIHKLDRKKLEEDLASKLVEIASLKEQILALENQLKSSKLLLDSSTSIKKELDSKCADLESKIIVLESKNEEKEQNISSLENDVAKHLKDLKTTEEDNKKLKYQLELAQKEGNKKSLLDLEMADYERSITELNNKIKKKEDEIEELKKEMQSLKERNDSLQEELKSTETLKETEAKRAESLKEILEKTKLELNQLKEHEAELLSKSASFEIHLETVTQQEESYKLRLSETSSQIQHLQDVIKTSSENHQRIIKSFEQKISNQKEEIQIAHKEVESVKQEFENYKIRVHSVLKQQKSVTPAITTVDGDLKEKLETINEKLKLQVNDLSEKLTAITLEYETLQEEHENLLQRYNKAIDDREQKDKEWHQRLELINAEKTRLRASQEELSSQHLLQNEMLVATYKKQIKIMSDEHKRIVSDLQKQLDAADIEIARLQRDQQKLQGIPVAPLPQESSGSFDLLSQERQEGEGSENTDEINTPIRHLSLATIPTSGFLSFEKLLQSPVEPGTPASFISNYDSEKLAIDLNTSNKKIDHLSELLNDSESTNMKLSEQVRVLKDEVRRLENNKEREQHAENLEYLKNVFVKFATLQPGSEKAMLIPVLTTMLKLNSSELQELKSVAGDVPADDNLNASWGTYLHRWSGLS